MMILLVNYNLNKCKETKTKLLDIDLEIVSFLYQVIFYL
jgi:hypothetical protein